MTDQLSLLTPCWDAQVQEELLSQSWDAHAKEWINWVRAPGRQDSYWRFHGNEFLSLVPKPDGLTVDIGCGEGRVGRDLRDRGHKTLGVDRSFTMVNAAMTHPEAALAIMGDAENLPLADASAGCVIAFMSLQDIDNMPGAISEIARILRDDRRLVLAIVHPMYSGARFDETAGDADRAFTIKRSYLKAERCIRTDRLNGDGLTMTFHREHRPLQAYVEALLAAGFSIEKLHEITDPDPAQPRHGIPMFLDIVAVRQPRKSPAVSGNAPANTPAHVPGPPWRHPLRGFRSEVTRPKSRSRASLGSQPTRNARPARHSGGAWLCLLFSPGIVTWLWHCIATLKSQLTNYGWH